MLIWCFAKKSRIILSKNRIADALKCPPNAQKNENAKQALNSRYQRSSFCKPGKNFWMKYFRKLHRFIISYMLTHLSASCSL